MAVIKTKEETFVSRKGGNFENRVDVFLLLPPPLHPLPLILLSPTELNDTRASRDCVPLMTIELRVNSIMPRAAQNLF